MAVACSFSLSAVCVSVYVTEARNCVAVTPTFQQLLATMAMGPCPSSVELHISRICDGCKD